MIPLGEVRAELRPMASAQQTAPLPAIVNTPGQPLPAAVVGDRTDVPPALRQELKHLMGAQPVRFLFTLALTWTIIFAAITLAALCRNVWVSILVVLFIGTRQNVLAVLLHEQVHRLGFRGRLGDCLCNCTIAYPLLITLEGYRRVHLAHHLHYFTERDPDYVRKQGPDWTFPQRARRLLRLFFLDATGLHTWQLIRSKSPPADAAAHGPPAPPWLRPAYYLLVAGVLVATDTWLLFLLYWLLPLLTVLQVIVRWEAICEHKYDLVNPAVAESTPFIRLPWWEALLLPNLNFRYHIYHHWYPAVPWFRLPKVHALFVRAGLVNEQNIFPSYLAYWKHLITSRLT